MNPEPTSETSFPMRLLVLLGGGALLAAMATDFLAVIGRHVGWPLLGSIELVQAFVLVSASVAMVMATLAGSHAVVHLLIDRASPKWRAGLIRANRLFSALFFIAILIGSIWIAADNWNGHEESELLGLPLAPLRIIGIICSLTVALVFLRQAFERSAK